MSRHTRAHRSSRHLLLAVVALLLVIGPALCRPGRGAQVHQDRRQRFSRQARSPVRVGEPHGDGLGAHVPHLRALDREEPGRRFVLPHPDRQEQGPQVRAVRVHLLLQPSPRIADELSRGVHPVPPGREALGDRREDHDPEESDRERLLVGGGEPMGRTGSMSQGLHRLRAQQLPRHPARHGPAGRDHERDSAARVGGLDHALPSPSRSRSPTHTPGSSHGPSSAARSGSPRGRTSSRDRAEESKEPRHHRRRGHEDSTTECVAIDKQGNQKISLSRRVYIPTDDDDLGRRVLGRLRRPCE